MIKMFFQNKEKRQEIRLKQLKTIDEDNLKALKAHNKSEIVHLYSEIGKTHSYLYTLWCQSRIEELIWENKKIEELI